jgi:hypothetical protein
MKELFYPAGATLKQRPIRIRADMNLDLPRVTGAGALVPRDDPESYPQWMFGGRVPKPERRLGAQYGNGAIHDPVIRLRPPERWQKRDVRTARTIMAGGTLNEYHVNLESRSGQWVKEALDLPYQDHSRVDRNKARDQAGRTFSWGGAATFGGAGVVGAVGIMAIRDHNFRKTAATAMNGALPDRTPQELQARQFDEARQAENERVHAEWQAKLEASNRAWELESQQRQAAWEAEMAETRARWAEEDARKQAEREEARRAQEEQERAWREQRDRQRAWEEQQWSRGERPGFGRPRRRVELTAEELAEAKRARSSFARTYHPDKFSGHPLQRDVEEALKLVNDRYDKTLKGHLPDFPGYVAERQATLEALLTKGPVPTYTGTAAEAAATIVRRGTLGELHVNLESETGQVLKRLMGLPFHTHSRVDPMKAAVQAAELIRHTRARDPEGNPLRLYHGSPDIFDEWTLSKSFSGGLYGPGGYFTEHAEVANRYAHGFASHAINVTVDPHPSFEAAQAHMAELLGKQYDAHLSVPYPIKGVQHPWAVVSRWPEANGRGTTENIHPVYLDVRRPFDVDAPADPRLLARANRTIAHWEKRQWYLDMARSAGREPLAEGATNHQLYEALTETLGGFAGFSPRTAKGKARMNRWLQGAGFDSITHIDTHLRNYDDPDGRTWIALKETQIQRPWAVETHPQFRRSFPADHHGQRYMPFTLPEQPAPLSPETRLLSSPAAEGQLALDFEHGYPAVARAVPTLTRDTAAAAKKIAAGGTLGELHVNLEGKVGGWLKRVMKLPFLKHSRLDVRRAALQAAEQQGDIFFSARAAGTPEIRALEQYQDSSQINRLLRTGAGSKTVFGSRSGLASYRTVGELRAPLDRAARTHATVGRTTVWRGVEETPHYSLAQLHRSALLRDQGYLSTSLDRKIAAETFASSKSRKAAVMEITLPRGFRAAAIDQLPTRGGYHEAEVLLPRRTPIRINAVEQEGNLLHVRAEALRGLTLPRSRMTGQAPHGPVPGRPAGIRYQRQVRPEVRQVMPEMQPLHFLGKEAGLAGEVAAKGTLNELHVNLEGKVGGWLKQVLKLPFQAHSRFHPLLGAVFAAQLLGFAHPGAAHAAPSAGWREAQAKTLAMAIARTERGMPGGILDIGPRDLVDTSAHYLDSNKKQFYSTYDEFKQVVRAPGNRQHSILFLDAHGGGGLGVATAEHEELHRNATGLWKVGQKRSSWEVTSLPRIQQDLPPNIQEVFLGSCNPRAVLARGDIPVSAGWNSAHKFGFNDLTIHNSTEDIHVLGGRVVGRTPVVVRGHGKVPIVTYDARGKSVGTDYVPHRSGGDLFILAGHATNEPLPGVLNNEIHATPEMAARAAKRMAWARQQLPPPPPRVHRAASITELAAGLSAGGPAPGALGAAAVHLPISPAAAETGLAVGTVLVGGGGAAAVARRRRKAIPTPARSAAIGAAPPPPIPEPGIPAVGRMPGLAVPHDLPAGIGVRRAVPAAIAFRTEANGQQAMPFEVPTVPVHRPPVGTVPIKPASTAQQAFDFEGPRRRFRRGIRSADLNQRTEVDTGMEQALRSYKGAGYEAINDALRDEELDPLTRRMIGHLDRAVASRRLSRPTTLWRGVNLQGWVDDPHQLVGRELMDPAFLSTTRARAVADSFGGRAAGKAVIEINAPAGAPVFDYRRMNSHWGKTRESEMLLGRDSRLRVTNVAEREGLFHITADLMSDPVARRTGPVRVNRLRRAPAPARFGPGLHGQQQMLFDVPVVPIQHPLAGPVPIKPASMAQHAFDFGSPRRRLKRTLLLNRHRRLGAAASFTPCPDLEREGERIGAEFRSIVGQSSARRQAVGGLKRQVQARMAGRASAAAAVQAAAPVVQQAAPAGPGLSTNMKIGGGILIAGVVALGAAWAHGHKREEHEASFERREGPPPRAHGHTTVRLTDHPLDRREVDRIYTHHLERGYSFA